MWAACLKRGLIFLGVFVIVSLTLRLNAGQALILPPGPFESTDRYAWLIPAPDGTITKVQAKVKAPGPEPLGMGQVQGLFRYKLLSSADSSRFYLNLSKPLSIKGLNQGSSTLIELDFSEEPIPAGAYDRVLYIDYQENPGEVPKLLSEYRPEQLLFPPPQSTCQASLATKGTAQPGLPLLGPVTFLREREKPKTEQISFSVPEGTGPFLLRLSNGNPEGDYRVSSAVVRLNGKEVFRPSELSQKAAELTRAVVLQPGENLVEVRLRSIPGGFITLELDGLDSPPCSIFGPRIFERQKGKPFEENAVFGLKPQFVGPFTLNLMSGAPDGSHRVDSAVIKLNGEQVFGPSDFNERVGSLGRTVSLQPNNTLSVELRGKPGDFLTLKATGYDKTPPSVIITSPSDGAISKTSSIRVSGTMDDPSCSVAINGTSVPVAPDGSFVLEEMLLEEGENTVHVIATDGCGNQGEDQISVYLRTAPEGPSLILCAERFYEQQPKPPGSNCKSQAFSNYLGLVTGLTDETAVSVTLNGIPLPDGVEIDDEFGWGIREGNFFWMFFGLPSREGIYPYTAVVTNAEGGQTEATVTFLTDTIPPRITITSPATGLITNTSTVTITGTVDDPAARVTLESPYRVIPVVNGNFTIQVNLREGSNTVFISAKDLYGNYSHVMVGITLDTLPPQINVISPVDGMAVRIPTLEVRGTVTDQNIETVTVAVNDGQPQILSLTGTNFSGTIILNQGTNTLTLDARDKAGNTARVTWSVLLDSGVPVVSITSPASGAIVSGSIVVAVEASDSLSGVGSVTLFVDGGPWATITQAPFNFSVSTSALVSGSHTLLTRATDRAGNQAETSITIVSDRDAPTVSITAPVSGTAHSGTILVKVGAGDPISGIASVSLLINGQSQATLSQPPFDFLLNTSPFASGPFLITARATDRAGNQADASISILLDHEAPTISITTPQTGAKVSGTVTVAVEAGDATSGVANVTLSVDGQSISTLSQAPFSFLLDTSQLTMGPHTLTAKAADKAETHAETSIAVTVVEGLRVEIVSPSDGTTLNKSMALIRGKIYNQLGEVGMRVNGTLAEVQGSDFAVIVPLQQGQNILTAVATAADGLQAQISITINTEHQQEQIRLTVSPTSGILDQTGVLNVMFEAETSIVNPISSYSWDLNGDGLAEITGTDAQIVAQYQVPSLYFPRVTVRDSQGNVYTETNLVNVLSGEQMDALLRSKWEGMKGVLSHGNITEALNYFLKDSTEEYREIFELLTSYLPSLVSAMREINMVEITGNMAEYYIKRFQKGMDISYFIYFMKDENGIWKISTF